MKNNFNIAITGSNGYVARHLRKFFSSKKIAVLAISRTNFQKYKLEKKVITPKFSKLDILPELKKCNILIHLISTTTQTVNKNHFDSTVESTKKIIELCKICNIKKIIYISGLGASKNTTSGYFISKYLAEQEIIHSGICYTIFRPSDILGYDDYLSKNLKKQIKSDKIIIPGSGKYVFQPIFVDDVSKIIFDALSKKKYNNKIISLVGPETITFEKYVTLFLKNSKIKIHKIDLEKAYYDALHNDNVLYGVDDLNMMISSFQADFENLQKFSKLKFTALKDFL
ncbi:NAD-dependent epimerase/dehydratase family protein [Candidatus Nitrosarchaeum limnium]|uniref:NAD-binding protein n=1 Tax=Candidatus Nitrosarchaeum limnium BG20 TaxID=859192 RepID=S2E734_9ARCH|nr:NAD-dependent epimerase/dehydratase family protein [Candidatus Nitrosarchaeum limnium]EPA05281.1 NAD-binding protein [Candidatus Nitrosarchaeum limnium BG20]